MSYNTKYNLTFKDFLGTQWDVDFQIDGFVGAVTDLVGTSDPVKINYETSEYFTHSPIKASSVEINLIETVDDAYLEFFLTDKAAKVKIYRGIDLYWQGWTIASEYHSLYNVPPKRVSLLAVDGLTFLKNIPLNVTEGAMPTPGIYSLKLYIKQAIDQIGLGTLFYESMDIYDTNMNQTNSPIVETYLDSWRFYRKGTGLEAGPTWGGYDNPGMRPYDNLYNVLSAILTAYGARIYQKDGCWYIDHIRQLSADTITYRAYSYLFNLTGTSVETRKLDITSASGSPRLVPIDHSLYKDFDRPYSQFVLGVNLDLDNNLIRYEDIFLGNGYTAYKITEKFIQIMGINFKPNQEGIVYNCGRIDFTSTSDKFELKLSLTGQLVGIFKVMIYIKDETDTLIHTYRASDKTWPLLNPSYPDSMYCLIKASEKDTSDNYTEETFTSTADIIGTGCGLKGEIYVLISPPWIPGVTGAFLKLDRNNITLDYVNAHASNKTYTLTNSSFLANKGSITTDIYSRFLYESYEVNSLGQGTINYITSENARLLYPGLLYYHDGTRHQPAYQFQIGTGGNLSLLEMILTQDIMLYYSVLRNKLLGNLLGNVGFGSTLEYDGKKYMIASLIKNIKRSQNEVALLQIAEVGSYWINEDGSYLLDEDGNKIPV